MKKTLVKVLRDTEAAQFPMKKFVPCGSNSATGEFVVIQGINGGFVSVPLHRIHLMSELISIALGRSSTPFAYEGHIYAIRRRFDGRKDDAPA